MTFVNFKVIKSTKNLNIFPECLEAPHYCYNFRYI